MNEERYNDEHRPSNTDHPTSNPGKDESDALKKKGRVILMDHGGGGQRSDLLIRERILPLVGNPLLNRLGDGAVFDIDRTRLAFSTDAYVVDPIFFPGGSIGRLAVCGTVNDLSMCGARPLYLSSSLIIEEGFSLDDLERILVDMARAANEAGVRIVTGDTKVVLRGAADRIFITTSGIGVVDGIPFMEKTIEPGDRIILSGTLADHGMAILSAREALGITSSIVSDTAPLNHLTAAMLESGADIKFLRDPTRGGLASVLHEMSRDAGVAVRLHESAIPMKPEVSALCRLLGFDPLYVANEGKLVAVVAEKDADNLLRAMNHHDLGRDAAIIGEVINPGPAALTLRTAIGGDRIIPWLSGEQLPRIC